MNFRKITEGIYRFETEGYFSLLTRYNEFRNEISSKYKETKISLANDSIIFDNQSLQSYPRHNCICHK